MSRVEKSSAGQEPRTGPSGARGSSERRSDGGGLDRRTVALPSSVVEAAMDLQALVLLHERRDLSFSGALALLAAIGREVIDGRDEISAEVVAAVVERAANRVNRDSGRLKVLLSEPSSVVGVWR